MSVLETHDGNLESQVEHRSEEVWFEDGNIVLRAQDVLFRVYKGILSRESPVFMDLFKLPQPEQQKEVHEESGCPVVEVQEKAEDMEMFLTVLLDSKYVYHIMNATFASQYIELPRVGRFTRSAVSGSS